MDDWVTRLAELFAKAGFDRALLGARILSAGEGRAEVRMPVAEAVGNYGGTLHGGAIAALVDDVGTLALITADNKQRPGVTTDLNVTFLAPAPIGDAVRVEAQVLKVGRTLGFVSVDVRRESDGQLVAQGRMTKHMGNA